MRDRGSFNDPASPRATLLIECGQHWEKSAVDVARDTLLRFLAATGSVPHEAIEGRLSVTPPTAQRVVRVTEPVVAKSMDFEFLVPVVGLGLVARAGTPIARDGDTVWKAPYNDTVLVMQSLRHLRLGNTQVRLGRYDPLPGRNGGMACGLWARRRPTRSTPRADQTRCSSNTNTSSDHRPAQCPRHRQEVVSASLFHRSMSRVSTMYSPPFRFVVVAALLLVAFGGLPASARSASKTGAEGKSAAALTVDSLNAASLVAGPGRKVVGVNAIARAQVLLDRAWFSPGEIDGKPGRNLTRAATAFQMSNGLKTSGRLDAATVQALEAGDGGAAFKLYTITASDAAGPFTPTPVAMAERAQLKSLDYENIREALAERFHLSEPMLVSLNRGRTKKFEVGDEIIVPDVTPKPPVQGAAKLIEIDKSDKTLWVLGADRKVLAAFPISIGGRQDPLPIGQLKIISEVPNPSFTYNPAILKNAPKDAAKVEVAPGPNNPVGNLWLGLSKPHWGIHGTPVPSKLGHEETNGCVHLTNWDANRLAKLVKPGFIVDVRP